MGMADAAQDPADFPTSPALAAPKALRAAGLQHSDVDYWEINEAFAVVDMVNRKLLDLDPDRYGCDEIRMAIELPFVPMHQTGQCQSCPLLKVGGDG